MTISQTPHRLPPQSWVIDHGQDKENKDWDHTCEEEKCWEEKKIMHANGKKKKKEKVGTLFRFIKKINGYKEITKIITWILSHICNSRNLEDTFAKYLNLFCYLLQYS